VDARADTIPGDTDYRPVAHRYSAVRRADPRLAAHLHDALGDAGSVLNVGAGTGGYEPADRDVVAVEPSAAMRAQRGPSAAPVVAAVAAALPFVDDAFDASMAVLSVHQWPDQVTGLAEMRRVTTGPVVVLTFDPEALGRQWLAEYSPEVLAVEQARFPPIEALADALGGTTEVRVVPIPRDCTDGFGEAFYARPERFLDPEVRRCQSGWSKIDEAAERRFVETLGADLESGAWDRRHGHLRSDAESRVAVRLVIATP
jgi:SAM-dependent methyltransferase